MTKTAMWVPLRHLVSCLDGMRRPLNSEERSLMQGDIPYWGANGVVDYVDRPLFNETLVLLGEDGVPFFEAGRDVAFLVEGPVWVNNHIHVLRPLRVEPRYLKYSLNAVDYGRYISGSTRDKLTQEDMRQIEIWCPPLDEQRRIADFLDAETSRVDALVEARRRWASLLRERWQSSIERRMMRATSMVPLKRVLAVPPQYGAQAMGGTGEQDWPRYIRITDVTDRGDLRTEDIQRLDPRSAAPYMLSDGDILLARSGATVGKGFRYRSDMGRACFAGYLIKICVDRNRVLPEYVDLWLRSSHYWSQIFQAIAQATIQNVNAERYSTFVIPITGLENYR